MLLPMCAAIVSWRLAPFWPPLPAPSWSGIGIAIWLVRPLRDLSVAMQAFSVGASPVFPRQSRIREVAYLTNEFIALYDRLAAVAAERERAEETRARLAAIVPVDQ